MIRIMTAAVAALLVCGAAAQAAVLQLNGNLSSYTTVVGSADPYGIGLPETFTLSLNTTGNAVSTGTLTFTGDSGKQFSLSGGVLTIGATTDFTSINMPTTGGAIGGTVSLSFATTLPNTTQAGLDTLIGQAGSMSLFGFPFANGNQGFYTGSVTGVAVPEPAAIGAIALVLPLLSRRRR
jgi:hypothetical protein